MGRFDGLLAQVSDRGRFSSVLDKLDDFGWTDVSPILQRKRKPDGGYEYRPNPARGQGAPGVDVQGEDPREKAIREAQARTFMSRPQSVPEQIMEQLKPRIAANIVSMPEIASGLQGIAERVNPGMRPRRPLPPGASPAELLNPRTHYPKAAREVVDRVYSEREEAAQALARKMIEAGYSPKVSALADSTLELVAQTAGDVTNALPGIGLLGAARRAPAGLAPDAMLSREAGLAAQLPETPLPAPMTRGAETLARAMGKEEADVSEASGRRDYVIADAEGNLRFDWRRQGDSGFPPDLDPWIRRKGLDPERMGHKEKLDLYGEMNAQERAAHQRDFGQAEPAPTPPPELTRERWEEVRNLPASRLAAGKADPPLHAALDHAELTASAPRWAASSEEAVNQWDGFLDSKLAADPRAPYVRIDPQDLPFETVNLPIARFSNKARPGLRERLGSALEGNGLERQPERIGKFYTLGEQTAYMTDEAIPGEGGASVAAEHFTPRNPLVLARGRLAETSVRADNSLIRMAEGGGHDAILIFGRGREAGHVEVVKTRLAGEGVPRDATLYDALTGASSYQDYLNLKRLAFEGVDEGSWAAVVAEIKQRDPASLLPAFPGDAAVRRLRERMRAVDATGQQDWKRMLAPSRRGEAGFLRIGPDPVRADPATEAFRASVFQEQPARPPVTERLRAVKDKLLAEFVSASDPYVARMAKAGAGPEAETLAHELRRAGHTALQPITYSTRRWDPSVRQWEYTGEPLEAWTARMDEATQRQVEAVLAAETQSEFAGRYEAARTGYGLAKAQKRAERLVLREEGKTARAGIRGIEAEARVLRAEELRAARAAGRATGKAQTLSPLVSRASATGKRADEALRDLVHAARDSEEAADAAARFLVRERAWRDVAEQGWREGEKRWRRAGASGLRDPGAARGWSARGVEKAAYESGVSDAALDAAYEAVTAGRRAKGLAGRELTATEKRLAAAQAERTKLEGVRGQAAAASRKKLDEVIRANRDEARAAVAREKERAKISRLQRPADLDLDIDKVRTAESRAYLAQMQGSGEMARLQPHLDDARAYMDRAFLQPLERLGVFSPAELAEIRAKNQHYSILTRAEERIGQELRSGEAVATKTSPVGRRAAGLVEDGQYVPPIEAIAMQAARVDKFQVRQLVRNDLAERVVQSPDLFPELMPAKVGEAGSFVAWKDGKQYAIKAPGDLLDVIDNVTPEQSYYVWRAARTGATVLRTLATLAPHFPGMNFLRDQATAAVFSQSKRLFGFVPYYSPAKELVKEIAGKVSGRGGSKAWKDFQASPGGSSTFLRADREGMSRVVREARMRATPKGRTALKIREAANPLFVPATVGNALESATRIAERELLLREGAGAREASRGAATVSIDFSDGGRFTKKVNEVVAFFNVRFLDPARFIREVKKRPFTIAARATAFITLPALAEEWFHRDDPGYHDLPLWDQAAFYHVGRSTEGIAEGWYKRIPRPLGLASYVFGLLPQLALRQQLQDDPHAADLAMRGLLQDTPAGLMFSQNEQGGLEPSMEGVPTIARGPAELIANRKWTGAPVVADPRVPPEQQYNDRTSPFVREIAGKMPEAAPDFLQSPQQLEHLVSAQTAGTGRLALDLLNPATRKVTGEAEPPSEPFSPRDVPVVRSFMSPPPEGFESLPVEDVYRFADRVDSLSDLLRKVEASDPARARILRATYPEISAASGAKDATAQLGVWRKEREAIKAAKIPDELKRARLRRLDKNVTKYAEGWMKEWRKSYPDLLQ